MNEDLPEEWLQCYVGAIYTATQGVQIEKNRQYPKLSKGLRRYLYISDFKHDGSIKYVEDIHPEKVVINSDLIMANTGSPGEIFKGKDGILSNNLFKLGFLNIYINSNFTFYFFKSPIFKEHLQKYHKQTAQPHIGHKVFSDTPFSLPPLAEQQEIATRLDDLLAQVDTIKARLDAIPAILKRFRQSVLAAAVSGKLTEDWRETKKMQRYMPEEKELESFKGEPLNSIPAEWQWLSFDKVAVIASNLVDPLLTPNAKHIAPNHIESGTGKLLEYTTVTEDKVTSGKHRFYAGQILYSKIRPYLCKVVVIDFDGLCSADMYPINTNMNLKYLFYWMLSTDFTDWASNAESRSVLPKINQKDLGKIPTPTPPLEEQTEIVRRVEQLFTFADQIEQQIQAAQARVNKLTQAILAKAFKGKLTADWRAAHPELISGENSAQALLDKIKATTPTPSKPKRSKAQQAELF